jgi:serine acetyltransferase
VVAEAKSKDHFRVAQEDQLARIVALENAERDGLFSLMYADFLRNLYQTRWRHLSTYPAWQRPWQALTFILRFDTLWAVWWYRLKRFCLRWRVPVVPRILDRFLAAFYQIQIGDHVFIGPGLYIPHGFVVIDGFVEIGRNCVISPFVTIGLRNSQDEGFSFFGPQAGDGLWIGTHTALLGDISLGDHTSIGASSLVLSSLPGYCTAAGKPARVIREFDREEIAALIAIRETGYQGG